MHHPSLRRLAWLALALALAVPPAHAQAPSGMQRLVSLDATDSELTRVLAILAERGGFNVITGPGVTAGRISVRMRDVPVEQAINLVVRAAGLAYERIGNSIVVAEARSLKEETGLSSYVVELKYADATEVQQALSNVAQNVQVDKGGNRLIVVTSPRVIAEIEEIVRVLDVPVKQVMLEARIVEVSTDAAKRLGIDWDQLNRREWIFVEGNYDSLVGGTGGQFTNLQVFPNTPGTADVLKFRNFSRVADVYRVAIDLMIRDGSARVLANPKLTTLNGKEASMLIGSRIPFVISGTAFSSGAAAPVQSIEREEVGIKLRITPQINADGFITTVIEPEVSSVIGFQGENNDLPVVATRQASTTVRLKDGSSVIIGGLLSEERTSQVTKVPILGQIPGLGVLFQHHTSLTTKRDLVIEVTPRVLPDQP